MRVIERLRDFRKVTAEFDQAHVLKITGELTPSYFVLALDPETKRIFISAYRKKALEQAEQEYLNVERQILGKKSKNDAVLVSVDKLINPKKAYPNYYGDTEVFLEILNAAIA